MALKNLTFILTERCNLNCYYCFEDRSTKDMNLDTAQAAVEVLLRESKELPSIDIKFFGGEPLLKFDMIREITRYAQRRSSIMGKSVTFRITTNSTLITQDVAEFFRENRFEVTLSWDGDKARITQVKGEKAYQNMWRGVRLLKKNKVPYHARLTASVDDMRLVDFAKEVSIAGFSSLTIYPIIYMKLNSSDIDKKVRELADYYMGEIENGKAVWLNQLVRPIMMLLDLQDRPLYFCDAGVNSFTVDVGGSIYPCFLKELSGNEFLLGNVFEGKIANKTQKQFQDFSSSDLVGCGSCLGKSTCNFLCIGNNYGENRNIRMPAKNLCVWTRACHKAAQYLLNEHYIKNKDPEFVRWIIGQLNIWRAEWWVKKLTVTDLDVPSSSCNLKEFYFNLMPEDLEEATGRKIQVFLDNLKKIGTSVEIRKPLPPCLFDKETKKLIDSYKFPTATLDIKDRSSKFETSFTELFNAYKKTAKMPLKCQSCSFRLLDKCHYPYFEFKDK